MKSLTSILKEQVLNLDQTEKSILASMAQSESPKLAYAILIGSRNAVTAGKELRRMGYIRVNDSSKSAELTDKGKQALVDNNLADEAGDLTKHGEDMVDHFNFEKGEWKTFESFKYLL